MNRKAKKDWSFSDGTIIPAGVSVCVASAPMNRERVRLLTQSTLKM